MYIYYGNSKTGGVNTKADVIIIGEQRYSNLGTRLLAADINLDGFNDIIIGSKYSPMGGEQQGSVIAFLSRKTDTKIQQRYFSGQADLVLKGEQNYSWFGHDFSFHNNTSVGPVLIVSAPTYRYSYFILPRKSFVRGFYASPLTHIYTSSVATPMQDKVMSSLLNCI